MIVPESLKCGDYIKVVSGLFKGLYATVLGKSYGDEVEIQYFQERFGKRILKENDIDSRLPEELIKVTAKMDRRSYFIFLIEKYVQLLLPVVGFSCDVSLQTVVNKLLVIANCLVPTCVHSSKNGLKNVGTTKGRSIIVCHY